MALRLRLVALLPAVLAAACDRTAPSTGTTPATPAPTPEAAWRALVAAEQAGDGQAIWRLWSSDSQRPYVERYAGILESLKSSASENQGTASAQHAEDVMGRWLSDRARDPRQRLSGETLEGATTDGGAAVLKSKSADGRIRERRFTLESGAWRLSSP